ncbi:MAG: hypothetical protein AAB340_00820 [Patescibacteria group bacterium]
MDSERGSEKMYGDHGDRYDFEAFSISQHRKMLEDMNWNLGKIENLLKMRSKKPISKEKALEIIELGQNLDDAFASLSRAMRKLEERVREQ